MTSITFSAFSNGFGFIAAVTSLLVLLVNICRSHLPSSKIKELERLMDETEVLFKRFVNDGLLMEPEFRLETESVLTVLRTTTHSLQSRVYSAATLRQDYLEFFRGTSRAIGDTCKSLKTVKAQVITSSERGRHILQERDSVLRSTRPPLSNPERHQAISVLPTHISRPHSCPPVLIVGRLDDWRHEFARGNPSH